MAEPYFPAISLICHRLDVDGESWNGKEFGIAVNKSKLRDREVGLRRLILFSRVRKLLLTVERQVKCASTLALKMIQRARDIPTASL